MRKYVSGGRFWGFLALTGSLFLVPATAQALDCGKAATIIEKAICADAKVKAVDDAMSKAYARLWKQYDKVERKALAALQLKWLKEREESCEKKNGEALALCVAQETQSRLDYFTGKPLSGPGTGTRMIPQLGHQDSSDTTAYIEVQLSRFAQPRSAGEKLFNAEIAVAAGELPYGETIEGMGGSPYQYFVYIGLEYASPKFISTEISTWNQVGGTNSQRYNINIDLQRGVAWKVEDWFDDKAVVELKKRCLASVIAAMAEEGQTYDPTDPLYTEESIGNSVVWPQAWSIARDTVTVNFDTRTYGRGPDSCEFRAEDVWALAKPGFKRI
jgi:uncharacterized protein YecT (DUF1311 family)